jgi:hypothetical protein
MKRTRRTVTVAAAALVLALLACLAGCDEEWGNPQIRRQRQQEWTLSGAVPIVLDAETSNGEIVILGIEDADAVHVVARAFSRGRSEDEAEDRLDRLDFGVERTGERVVLRYRSSAQDEDVRRFSGVAFTVELPPDARLLLRTSNGAIRVESIRGNLTAATSNGAIDVQDITGSVLLETSNGRLQIADTTGDLRATTSNGEVRIDAAVGPVDVRTSNGAIDYSGQPQGMGNRLRTSNGSITARIPRLASIAVDASTSEGVISSGLPLLGDTDGVAWDATLNPPATARLSLRTSNGSIRIEGASPRVPEKG